MSAVRNAEAGSPDDEQPRTGLAGVVRVVSATAVFVVGVTVTIVNIVAGQ